MSDKPKADDGGAAAAVYSKLYHEERAKREQLERELSAANARIAELEDAVRRNGIKVSAPLGSLLSPHDIIEPSQPTTLPE